MSDSEDVLSNVIAVNVAVQCVYSLFVCESILPQEPSQVLVSRLYQGGMWRSGLMR